MDCFLMWKVWVFSLICYVLIRRGCFVYMVTVVFESFSFGCGFIMNGKSGCFLMLESMHLSLYFDLWCLNGNEVVLFIWERWFLSVLAWVVIALVVDLSRMGSGVFDYVGSMHLSLWLDLWRLNENDDVLFIW